MGYICHKLHQFLVTLYNIDCRRQSLKDVRHRRSNCHFEYKFILLLLLISLIFYLCYINELFVFKKDKYRKYFAEFDKKKKYLLYYSIYVVSLVVQLATFYLLLMEIVK